MRVMCCGSFTVWRVTALDAHELNVRSQRARPIPAENVARKLHQQRNRHATHCFMSQFSDSFVSGKVASSVRCTARKSKTAGRSARAAAAQSSPSARPMTGCTRQPAAAAQFWSRCRPRPGKRLKKAIFNRRIAQAAAIKCHVRSLICRGATDRCSAVQRAECGGPSLAHQTERNALFTVRFTEK
jgi:hypothetical protein